MRIENSYRIIPCYTADVSGVCSALYELGGMVVMHDPSGCNSTYNTHDETRWYDNDSLIYITGLTEIDAIMGNDKKVVRDITDAAKRLSPKFIALCGSPIPFLNGTDYNAIAALIEKECGIRTFAVETNGMHDYVRGAGAALRRYSECVMKPLWDKILIQKSIHRGANIAESVHCLNKDFVNEKISQKSVANSVSSSPMYKINTGISQTLAEHAEIYPHNYDKTDKNHSIVINILGATPLDFTVESSVCSLKNALINRDIHILTSFSASCGEDVDKLQNAVLADVNLVVSAVGMPMAEYMYEEYGIPYVIGIPVGDFADTLCKDILRAASEKIPCIVSYNDARMQFAKSGSVPINDNAKLPLAVTGEVVTMGSLAAALSVRYNIPVSVLCPLEDSDALLSSSDFKFRGEDQCTELMKRFEHVIADPLYLPICPKETSLHRLPHEAFSGRCCRQEMKDIFLYPDEWPDKY